MTKRAALLLALALGLVWSADVAAMGNQTPPAELLQFRDAGGSTFRVEIYDLSSRYVATIYGIGPYNIESPSLPVVSSFNEILKRVQASGRGAIVVDGGYSDDGLYTPAGLLMIKKLVAHPFSLQRKGASYSLSAVICLDASNHIKFYRTSEFDTAAKKVKAACVSALQAGPYIVEAGKNGINNSKPVRASRFVRVVIADDRSGKLFVVLFQDPIDLFTAGEILRGGLAGRGLNPTTKGAPVGLSMSDAVNLDGDKDTIIAVDGRVQVGDAARPIPSAIAVRSY